MSTKLDNTISIAGQTLIWKKSYSKTSVFVDRMRHIIDAIIYGILGFFGIAGLAVVIWHVFILSANKLEIFNLANWQFDHMLIWWWSTLTDLFLFYLINYRNRANRLVLNKDNNDLKISKKPLEVSYAFSKDCWRVLEDAYGIAVHDSGSAIQAIHIFAALLREDKIAQILGRLGIGLKSIRATVAKVINNDNVVTKGDKLNLDKSALDVIWQSYILAYDLRRNKVEVPEMLEAVVKLTPAVKDILFDFEITEDKIANAIAWVRIQQRLVERYQRYRYKAGFKPKNSMDRAMTAVATPVLDQYSDDMTLLARSGYFGLCVAREKEFEVMYQVLESGSVPLLVGQPGVGIDTILEGLANRMVAEEVPKTLQDKRLVTLQLSKLVAGTTHEGELEDRIMNIVYEIARAGNVVLYINNLHNLVGVSSVGRSNVDLSDILTESLLKRGVPVIASTNPHDYVSYIEHSSLVTTVTKVEVHEPDENSAIQMLAANIGGAEHKNQVFFSYDALEKAVKLSKRYIPDQFLPRKAIDIIGEVAVRVRNKRGKNQLITGDDVAEVISERAEVPLTQVTQDESSKLLNLEQLIHARLINQVEAVKVVAGSLRRARAELRDIKRPIANFLFLGPTGVGKTELAKTVAEVYFGDEKRMIRIDMSEYQEQNSIARMLGVPGQDEGGILTNAVRQDPHSILLLDEIEKAHPDILNVFLQVMEDGRMTDVTGRTVDFTNLILIATSNAGTNYIQDQTAAGATAEQIRTALMEKELRPYFRPEFLNRFDNIVVFKPLTEEHLYEIAKLLLKKEQKRLEEKGIFLEPTEEAIRELAHEGYDPMYGARPLRRVIQDKVQNALANFLLQGSVSRRDKVILEPGGQIRIEKFDRI